MQSALETHRLNLRPFEESDSEATYAYRSHPLVTRYWIVRPEAPEEVRAFLRRAREYSQVEPQTQFRFAVILKSTGQFLGGCGLDITNSAWRAGEIGYHLMPEFWGQGYGAEAARALVQFGFETLGLHRIFAECFPINIASARVMEKAGMTREAHLRQNKYIEGHWYDTLVYAILDHEWQQ